MNIVLPVPTDSQMQQSQGYQLVYNYKSGNSF